MKCVILVKRLMTTKIESKVLKSERFIIMRSMDINDHSFAKIENGYNNLYK